MEKVSRDMEKRKEGGLEKVGRGYGEKKGGGQGGGLETRKAGRVWRKLVLLRGMVKRCCHFA